ncbi:MAG: RimK family alpha-L-glutamate ligase [Candidatus Fimimonas sp.]
MKKGWLLVNGFLQSRKFNEIYRFFLENAPSFDAEISVVAADSLLAEATDDFSQWQKPDFVLFWDKDVCLAKRLEQNGFKLFNKASTVEICDSKTLTATTLAGKVPMPKTLFSPKTFAAVGYTNLDFVEKAAELLGLPMVIKESYGSFGQQVYLAKTLQQAKEIASSLAGKDFVMQRFVAESCGRDVRFNVVGGKVVNAVLRKSNVDFRSNVTLGGGMEKYCPSSQEIALAEKTCRILGADFAGVDVLLGKDGPLLCEVNSNLHFKSTWECTGVDISKHILQHVVNNVG